MAMHGRKRDDGARYGLSRLVLGALVILGFAIELGHAHDGDEARGAECAVCVAHAASAKALPDAPPAIAGELAPVCTPDFVHAKAAHPPVLLSALRSRAPPTPRA